MILDRHELEARERAMLAPYGMASGDSQGRAYPEAEHPLRTAFQRDRDRIVHTTAFRRLEYKTQVFVYAEGDHYRNRLTHTIEVAQIGRSLARSLGASEDLTEAICLAHDLGHPPFGHTGEETLNALMAADGGFDHQQQTMRIVTYLESRYTEFPGLNLTYEVREGIVKHDTEYDEVNAGEYGPEKAGTLECQLANLADEIAYNTSDLEDGLRSGILDPTRVSELGLWRQALNSLSMEPQPQLDAITRAQVIRRLIGTEVQDAIAATESNLRRAKVTSVASLRGMPHNLASFSPEVAAFNNELKGFLMANFYRHPRVMRMAGKAHRLLTALYEAYVDDPRVLPLETQARVRNGPDSPKRVICDYLAGMTDRFAILEHQKLFDVDSRV